MNKQIKDMTTDEIMNMPTLGLDDTFEFFCKGCGKCCAYRDDLLITPYDTYRIASYFGRTTQEIIERYCEVYEGGQSHFPVVRVKPIPPDNRCPFLRKSRCAVHSRKPVLCRVYPLARIHAMEGDNKGDQRYYFNGANCHHTPRTVTVREYIADVASEEAEQAGKLWSEVIATIHPLIQPDKIKEREQLMAVLLGALWLSYDMEKPFVPQLAENLEKLKMILNGL